jgi:hypothetical protein
MSYHASKGPLVARACWRDGRGALRCRRPGMAFSGDELALPGASSTAKAKASPEDFLIAQLNRFKGENVPAGQALGNVKIAFGSGISSSVALDALTVVIRRLQGSLEVINDDGARTLLADAKRLMAAGDASGTGALIKYVKDNAVAIGNTAAGFADSLGLPPAEFPTSVLGLSGVKLAVAAGAVGIAALLLWRSR